MQHSFDLECWVQAEQDKGDMCFPEGQPRPTVPERRDLAGFMDASRWRVVSAGSLSFMKHAAMIKCDSMHLSTF